MLEIIPAINATEWSAVKRYIEVIAPYADWVHLDVADGKFTNNITWNNPKDLAEVASKHIRFEVHLMVEGPEGVYVGWAKAGVRRIILHWETLKPHRLFGRNGRGKLASISQSLHNDWVEFGLSILYRTDAHEIEPYLDLVDMVQVLAVEPGRAGQDFRPEALARVSDIRRMIFAKKLNCKIEVDGGVNTTNIKDIYMAGADMIAAASAIFNSPQPHLALENLKRAVLG